MTDEMMAKKLGWKVCPIHGGAEKRRWNPPNDDKYCRALPSFTTDLSTIVAEIERRGLWWKTGSGIVIGGKKDEAYFADIHGGRKFYAPTAPLALCSALLKFLENSNAR